MKKLQPCPFCGGESAMKSSRSQNGHMHGWVGCPRCGAYIQWAHDPAETIKKWNRRMTDDKV